MRDILVNYSNNLQANNFFTKLIDVLRSKKYNIIHSQSLEDGLSNLKNNSRIVAYIFDWDSMPITQLEEFATINPDLPIFAAYFSHTDLDLELSNFKLNLDFLQYDRHLVHDDVQRIEQAIEFYIKSIVPPFTSALMNYVNEHKYTFCTPGHMSGSAFTESAVGSVFYDFLGENVFKIDVSISMPELGSLLDHSGAHKDAEEYIAQTFNADYSYIVTNGTSTANKIVGLFAASSGDTVLVDRNCHKSICHLMMMVDVTPIYMIPTRNAYGILGGIPQSEFLTDTINKKVLQSTLGASWPSYAVITNSTYDGLLYNTQFIKDTLSVKHLHFDSAWSAYTHFHPIYDNKYGMCDNENDSDKVIFETHSTHKLLAAFSQASMVHIKGDIDKEVMDECYMMHTSTSPLYQITASCEIASAMMRGNRGYNLINKAITHALNFRREIKKLNKSADDWYFDVWQNESFPEDNCCALNAKDSWHGFQNQDDNHMFLDPIKVTVTTPGIRDNKLVDFGIPASIVSMYLDEHGIILEKSGPYSMLFLFSIGVTQQKSLTLLKALASFKTGFDENQLVQNMLPGLYAKHTDFYKGMRIQELSQKIHGLMIQYNLPHMMYSAFDCLPNQSMTPYKAFQHLIKGNTETVLLQDMENKVSAVMVLPYPPGVPLIMPGEKITSDSRDILNFLLMLENIGLEVPGFESDIHGLEKNECGKFVVKVIASI